MTNSVAAQPMASTAAIYTLPNSSESWYKPPVSATWQWQLSGDVNSTYAVDLYDIDLFDVSRQSIQQLQASEKKVICYFSGGSSEDWRPDADQFLDADLGNALDGWPGEYWLDVRSRTVRSVMESRLDLAQEKGCDGVEPDNMDGYTNQPGLDFTAADQLAFNRFMAKAAHDRGLAIGLKNDLDQVDELVTYFDFAVNEQCFEFEECDRLMPLTNSGKPVLNAEYQQTYVSDEDARETLCEDALSRRFSTLILPLDLDDTFRFSCHSSCGLPNIKKQEDRMTHAN